MERQKKRGREKVREMDVEDDEAVERISLSPKAKRAHRDEISPAKRKKKAVGGKKGGKGKKEAAASPKKASPEKKKKASPKRTAGAGAEAGAKAKSKSKSPPSRRKVIRKRLRRGARMFRLKRSKRVQRGRKGKGAAGILKRFVQPQHVRDQAAARQALMAKLGMRAGRGQRVGAPLLNQLLAENAASLVVDELRHILSSAKRAAREGSAAARSTSRTRSSSVKGGDAGGKLAPEDAEWVLRDVALTAILFSQRNAASGGLDAKQQARVDRLLGEIGKLVGPEHVGPMRQMFREGVTRSGVQRKVKSLLGADGVRQLAEAVRSSSTAASGATAATMISSATLSAVNTPERNRRVRAEILRRRQARGSRSGDSRSAGTTTRSILRTSSGSLRTARASTATSKDAWDSAMSARFRAMVKAGSPERIVVAARERKVVTPERFMAGAVAISRLQELAAGAVTLRKKIAAEKSKPALAALREELAGLKREYLMELLQTTPKKLDRDERRMLAKQLDLVFATGRGSADAAKVRAKAELVDYISLKLAHPDLAALRPSQHSVTSRRLRLGELVRDRIEVLLGKREMSVLEQENRTASGQSESLSARLSGGRARSSVSSRTASRARTATTASRSHLGSGYLRKSSQERARRKRNRSV
jgi:hypothetical protein